MERGTFGAKYLGQECTTMTQATASTKNTNLISWSRTESTKTIREGHHKGPAVLQNNYLNNASSVLCYRSIRVLCCFSFSVPHGWFVNKVVICQVYQMLVVNIDSSYNYSGRLIVSLHVVLQNCRIKLSYVFWWTQLGQANSVVPKSCLIQKQRNGMTNPVNLLITLA